MRIADIKHKGLAGLYERGDGSKLDSRLVDKLKKMFLFLDAIEHSNEIKDWPLWKAHQLSDRRWSFHVTANYRLTFAVDDAAKEITVLDLEDYH
jgi:plasmid maintenance system killer protein